METRWLLSILAVVVVIAAVSGFLLLQSPGDGDEEGVYFVVGATGGEGFVIKVTDADTISLARENLRGENGMFPIGELERGDGGFNQPWSWHLKPDTVRMTDAATEVCDGRPSFVEEDLTYWLENVGNFCPWGGEIVAELGPLP